MGGRSSATALGDFVRAIRLVVLAVIAVAERVPLLRVRGDAAVLPNHFEPAIIEGIDVVGAVGTVAAAVAAARRLLTGAVAVLVFLVVLVLVPCAALPILVAALVFAALPLLP